MLGAKPESAKKETIEPVVVLATPIEKESSLLIEHYPQVATKKVSHKLDSLLQRINKRQDFNGSLLVAKHGKILYDNYVGYADFNKKAPVNEASIFQLASVSKQFTAAAIMLLFERNQIQLTDTVNKYFPHFPYENITIKNLLNHTSGLPRYFWVAEHEWNHKKAPTNSEMMELLESSKAQRYFKPGRNFDYSNTGYFVLASIVEKVSGKSFSAFVKKNIFEPLEMNDSFVLSSENDATIENHLDGYRVYRGYKHLKINTTVNDAIVGDKNVYSSSIDLLKWTLGLNSGKLLSKESVNLMYSKGETISGKKIPYGFGLRINTEDPNIIYHYGKWNGFSTGLTQYQKDDLVVIILEHTSYRAMSSLNKKVKTIISENFHS
ncbi:beta-lactamase family protein [Aureibaculum sp. A20]|uniref:Beta-lactamase family protein n=2 Tax=Aureibaculum flavum TaxID=2795986 RepID=A0ABS0WS96_9FLAO|nr:beta-lactamase family protein [Aureibaculum flavum]